MKSRLKVFVIVSAILGVAACSTPSFRPELKLADARLNPETVTEHTLKWLPGPTARIPIAVYGVADQTGSFKPTEGGQTLSRAVTQAPTPILIKALQDAGNRRWFSVIERENLQNILRERQIILDMRQRYLGETELNREALPALKFAGVLIEGAITGYDTNTVTGGAGARYLGIGGSTQYREDAVSVYLRAVSVKTGEVLISISSEQRVASIAASGNAFKFVAFQELLEAEAGLTLNQPRHLAVRQAFEKAVYGMIVEGAELGLWQFGENAAGQAAIAHYRSTYARAPKNQFEGVLPDAFYAARQREISRMHAAANANRQQTAALAQPRRAPRSEKPVGRMQQVQAIQQRAQAPKQQQAQPTKQSNTEQTQARATTQSVPRQQSQPRAVTAAARQSAGQTQARPVTPTPVKQPQKSDEPVVKAALQNTARAQTATNTVQAQPAVLKAPAAVREEKVSQTVLDALAALEALDGKRTSRVLTPAAVRNLLREQTIRTANATTQAVGDVGTQDRRVAPPPP